jgi:hypothetical protein
VTNDDTDEGTRTAYNFAFEALDLHLCSYCLKQHMKKDESDRDDLARLRDAKAAEKAASKDSWEGSAKPGEEKEDSQQNQALRVLYFGDMATQQVGSLFGNVGGGSGSGGGGSANGSANGDGMCARIREEDVAAAGAFVGPPADRPYAVLVPCHPKDHATLYHTLRSLRSHGGPGVRTMYVVSATDPRDALRASDVAAKVGDGGDDSRGGVDGGDGGGGGGGGASLRVADCWVEKWVHWVPETSLCFPFSIGDFDGCVPSPGWAYQQMLKFYGALAIASARGSGGAQDECVTGGGYIPVLLCDADVVWLKQVRFFKGGEDGGKDGGKDGGEDGGGAGEGHGKGQGRGKGGEDAGEDEGVAAGVAGEEKGGRTVGTGTFGVEATSASQSPTLLNVYTTAGCPLIRSRADLARYNTFPGAMVPGLAKRCPDETAVTHHMMIDLPILRALVSEVEAHHGHPLWQVFRDIALASKGHASEYELYFAFALTRFPAAAQARPLCFAVNHDWRAADASFADYVVSHSHLQKGDPSLSSREGLINVPEGRESTLLAALGGNPEEQRRRLAASIMGGMGGFL